VVHGVVSVLFLHRRRVAGFLSALCGKTRYQR
jgi:hypothetical protein